MIYRLGLGQSPFPIPVPVVDALKLHAHERDYLPAKGHPLLREAVAEFHRRKDGVEAHPDKIVIGPGSKELMFLLQLVYYGELLVPTPCWVSYVPQAKILGRQVSLIHTRAEERYMISGERLERHCAEQEDDFRPRILVLNYPNNPVGCSYSTDELQSLANAARKYQVVLLSDEIYGQLHHQGTHVSVARYYPEGTIISSGLSKWCGAGGWRLGSFTFPPDLDWLVEKMAVVASETYTSVSTPIQYAAISAFRGSVRIERYLWHARRILAALGKRCGEILTAGGLRLHLPCGGFYLFIDFSPFAERLARRGIANSVALTNRLLEETGVAMLPGVSLGRRVGELTARMAYVDFDGARALAASETMPLEEPLPEDFVDTWCGNVISAAKITSEWAREGEGSKGEGLEDRG